MKAINYHIKGIIKTFEELFKGKYLIYLLPGLVLTLIFAFFRYEIGTIDEAISIGNGGNSWWQTTLGYADYGVHGAFSWFDSFIEGIYVFATITLLSPFNAALASKFDKELTGFKGEGGFARFINDMIRMVFLVILMIIMEQFILGIYWCFTWFLPYEEVYSDAIKFCVRAFFFGLSFYDFALERREKGVFATIGYGFTYPLGMIITGAIFSVVYKIPWIGIPLSPVLAVMISTVAYLYYEKQLPQKSTELKPAENE